jgi:plasmid stabilization system protein ParE
MKKEVVWDELAVFQLENQLDYIRQESILQAEKVRESILEKTAELSILSEKHPIARICNPCF